MAMNPGLAAYMKNKQASKATQMPATPMKPMASMPMTSDVGKKHSKIVHTTKGKC